MVLRNDRVAPSTQVRSPARTFLQTVDTFYAPARDRRGEQAIQQGISAINSVLNERFEEYRADQRDDEYQQGRADALREQAGEEMQGVRTGNILRQNSRFYMAGLDETRGLSAATEFRRATLAAYQEWEDRNNDDDGTLFRDWMNQRVAEFTNTLGDNRHRIAGALPTVQQAANNLAQQHASYTSRRLEAEARAAYRNVHQDIWTQALNGDVPLEDALAASLEITEDQFDMEGGVANEDLVDALIDVSNFRNDPAALYVLEEGIGNGTIRANPEIAARVSNAIESVESDRDRLIAQANAQAEAEATAQREAHIVQAHQTYAADPYAPLPTIEELGGDFQAWNSIVTLRNTYQTASTQSDPMMDFGVNLEFQAGILEATNLDGGIQAISSVVQEYGPAYAAAGQQFVEDLMLRSSASQVLTHPVVRSGGEALSEQIVAFERDDWDPAYVSVLQTRGEYLYELNLAHMADAGEINGMNTVDILDATAVARERTITQLAREFPQLVSERVENANTDATRALGIEPAIQAVHEEALARIAEENAAAADELSLQNRENATDRALSGNDPAPAPVIDEPFDDTPSVSPEDMVMPFEEFGYTTANPEPRSEEEAPVQSPREAEVTALVDLLGQYEDVIANGGNIATEDVIVLIRAILDLPTSLVPSSVRRRAAELQRLAVPE